MPAVHYVSLAVSWRITSGVESLARWRSECLSCVCLMSERKFYRGDCERDDRDRPIRGTGWDTATDAQKTAWLMRCAARCPRDGLFKSRPSSRCCRCGDAPGTLEQRADEIDREHGWDWVPAELMGEGEAEHWAA